MRVAPSARAVVVGVALASPGGLLGAQGTPRLGSPAPVIASNGQFDVVFVSAPAASRLGEPGALARYLASCGRALAIPEGDSAAVSSAASWDWDAPGAGEPDRVTLLVSRTIAAEVDCDGTPEERRVAFGRGLRVTRDTALRSPRRILKADLYRDDRLIEPLERTAHLSTSLSSHGLLLEQGGILRMVLPLEAFRPDSTGRIEGVRIAITGADTVYAHSMRLREEALREVWHQLLEERASRAGTAVGAGASLVEWVALGSAFAEANDDAAARIVFRSVLAGEPCTTLAASVPPRTRALFERIHRPRARCDASVGRTALRAALIPGFGHHQGARRKAAGAAVLGVVTAAMVVSQSANDEARERYAAYLALGDLTPEVAAVRLRRAYDAAESKRVLGTRLVLLSATVWAASVGEAVWRERRLVQRLDRVRAIDPARRSLEVGPTLTARGVGLSITFR